MKAIIFGATEYLQNAHSMVKGIKNMGFEHGYFGYKTYFEKYGKRMLKEAIMKIIKDHQPEWLFCQYQFISSIDPKWFQEMRSLAPNIKISLMSVDMRVDLDKITLEAGKYADVCFQKGREDQYNAKGVNCKILQQGYSDSLFRKVDKHKTKFDIVFAGGLYKHVNFPGTNERTTTLKFLANNFNLMVVGTGWKKLLGTKSRNNIPLTDMNAFYNSSKIVLNINHFNNIEHYWSIRMIEGMASGRMMLTRYVPGMENYFRNHEDLVWFYSVEDCMDLARYYLDNEVERENIAKNGCRKVQASYKWEHIMKKAYELTFDKGENNG